MRRRGLQGQFPPPGRASWYWWRGPCGRRSGGDGPEGVWSDVGCRGSHVGRRGAAGGPTVGGHGGGREIGVLTALQPREIRRGEGVGEMRAHMIVTRTGERTEEAPLSITDTEL